MAKRGTTRLINLLTDKFSGVWKLLSDTGTCLECTALADQYEEQLRQWRHDLSRGGDYPEKVRAEIVALRRHLRKAGYDLTLGGQKLLFDGFRNDASLAQGFWRVVLFTSPYQFFFLSGEENHIMLGGFLEASIERWNLRERPRITGKHYLWYLRQKDTLILSGSDTETPEDYHRIRALGEADPLLFLSRLRLLR
ncbi:MAG: hypothetical protein LBI85_06145 [Spirochaetaceae bacterium]|jgi:hypothetical protein|nr:hypothetical protein [Spirochaetaceae bacterium]